ncbi:MAG: DUF502 domain-containing protein [Candidatus Hydrothermarchaeales archaeon]
MRSRLRSYFITGLLIFVPLVATIYILWIAFLFFDSILRPVVSVVIGREIPGLSLAVTVLIILLIGVTTTLAAGKKVLEVFEESLLKIPVVSGIYSIVKQASIVFFVQNPGESRNVVLVEYPRKGMYAMGFTASATVDTIQEKTAQKTINVFIPSTPNPTTGFLIMVPEEEVIPLDLSMEEALRLLLSGGLLDIQGEKNK